MADSIIDSAFILAAGKGTRLRPHTDHLPKPLVNVAGKQIIDHILEKLRAAGVQRIAVNTHYLGDKIKKHLKSNNDFDIRIFDEDTLLDTGGGVKNALPFFENKAFYVIAGDAFWADDGDMSALEYLSHNWNPEQMDILTLVEPLRRMTLTQGIGDYNLGPDGHMIRSKDKNGDYMWTNIRINAPNIYTNTPDGAFSFLDIMDQCEERKRLYGLVYDGHWHHISTPKDLARVNEAFPLSPETA